MVTTIESLMLIGIVYCCHGLLTIDSKVTFNGKFYATEPWSDFSFLHTSVTPSRQSQVRQLSRNGVGRGSYRVYVKT